MEKAPDMEKAIGRAMRARVGHFKAQADSLTLEGVRRLLEKDLRLEKFALDVHKRFIKQCLQECFDSPDDESISKTSGEIVEEIVHSEKEETTNSAEELQPKKEAKGPNSDDEEKMEGSPVLGLLTGEEKTRHETKETEGVKFEKVPSEETIKKAIKKRAAYFKANSEEVTMVKARRLLEEDLRLDKNALDLFRKFISEQLDKVLHCPEVSESPNGIMKKRPKKNLLNKVSTKVSRDLSSDSSDSEAEEVEDKVKPKKQITAKGSSRKSEGLKSRKRSASETKTSSNKRKKPVEATSEESSDAKDGGNLSEDGQSQSSADEPIKMKKEVSTHVYGKQVEHLKSIIKACGMSVPPSIYKKVKQAPENKRESYLIKELEEILGKEGLSTNPSEKEIKAIRKNKERAKELEGIDMSNIVSNSRRRSTSSFVIPPKPKIPVETNGNDDEDGTDGDDDDDEDDDDDDDSGSEGTSEEFNEDVVDESD